MDEAQWIALRELVPAASAPVLLCQEYAERYPTRSVTVVTVLPGAVGAVARNDGNILLGLQRHQHSGDVSRDIAAALLAALETQPGEFVTVPAMPGEGPRLQDLVQPVALDVTVHAGFDFWFEGELPENSEARTSLDRANDSIYPTCAMGAVPAAYWCRVPERSHIRWVLSEDEDLALNSLAKIAAAGNIPLGEGTKLAGMFRAHGRLIPVWDLPREREADSWEDDLARFAKLYEATLSLREPLTGEELRAKQGLLGRQIALR